MVDAFSDKPFYGNAAAIVVDADGLPDDKKTRDSQETKAGVLPIEISFDKNMGRPI